ARRWWPPAELATLSPSLRGSGCGAPPRGRDGVGRRSRADRRRGGGAVRRSGEPREYRRGRRPRRVVPAFHPPGKRALRRGGGDRGKKPPSHLSPPILLRASGFGLRGQRSLLLKPEA